MKKALAFLAVVLLALTGFGATKTFTVGSVAPNCGVNTSPIVDVDDASGLTDVAFKLYYDSTVITYSSCAALPGGWNAVCATGSDMGGDFVGVALTGADPGAGPMGLASLTFSVPAGACDGDNTALNLESVLYNTTNSGTAVDGNCAISCPANVPPAVFANSAPADGAPGVATANVVLDWADSAGAATYDLYFGTANPPALFQAGIAASTYTVVGPLANSTTYYWYVVAQNPCGSNTGAQWSFTTIAGAAPDVAYQSHTFVDDCPWGGAGDGDGVADPGEILAITMTLVNNGAGDATGVSGVLSTVTAGVTVTTPNANFPDLTSGGGTGAGTTAFGVTIGGAVACGTNISFSLDVTANGGAYTNTVVFQRMVGSPTLVRASTDVPKSIPDNGVGSGDYATSVINIAEAGNVTDVNVRLSITHTWNSDLDLYLVAPDATVIELSTDNGGSSDNYTNTLFDDAAATAITAGTGPFNGTYRPEVALSGLNGKSVTGVWTLRMGDDAGGDLGTLTAWTLYIQTDAGVMYCTTCACTPPGAFALLTPADGAVGLPVDVPLDWEDSAAATSYDLYLDTVNPPVTLYQTGLAVSNYTALGLTPGATYYWRVTAGNGCFPDASTGVWSFTIAVAAVPNLQYDSMGSLTDNCSIGGLGDANGAVDPGESATFTITLVNNGSAATTGVSGVLSTGTAGVTVTAPNAAFPDIGVPGGMGTSTTPFAIDVDLSVACGTVIGFSLDVTANGGAYTVTLPFTLTVGSTTPILLAEDFETWPLTGWTIINNGGCGTWDSNAAWGAANNTGGAGLCADADSDSCGDSMDTELRTPSLDLTTATAATLQYRCNFQDYVGNGDAYTDISTDGGSVWTNLRTETNDDVAGHLVTLDLTPYVGQPVIIRFHFVTPSWDWYWRVDDVTVTAVTAAPFCISCVCTPPGGFNLSAPPNGAVGINPANAFMDWTSSANALTYDLYLGTVNPPPLYQAGIAVSQFTASGLAPSMTYYWTVRAIGGCPPDATVGVWSFTTAGCVPTAYAVDIGAGNLVSFDLASPGSWTVVGAVGGDLYMGGDFLNGDFTRLYSLDYDTNEFVYFNTATAAKTVVGIANSGGQAWIGLSQAPSGTVYAASTDCSASSTLYTLNPATGATTVVGAITNAACLIDIAVNAAGQMYGYDLISDSLIGINPATGAGTVIGALGFDANYGQGMSFDDNTGILYLAAYNNSSFQAELRTANTTTGATTLVGAFPNPGTSQVDSLAITVCGCVPPGVFNLSTPANGATGVSPTNVTLNWTDSAGAATYDLYLGTVNPPPLYQAGLATSQYTVAALSQNTTYYWSVTADNACGSASAGVWSFTTGSSCTPPDEVQLLDPPDGAVDVPVPVTLSWVADPNATSYEVGLGLQPANLTLIGTTTETSYKLDDLAEGTTYYWRISALNDCGFSPSDLWSFTTAGQPGPGGSTAFIPAVASTTGDRSSQWKTDVHLLNKGDGTAAYSITFIPADTDGTQSTHVVSDTLETGRVRLYADIVRNTFALTETSGALRVVSDEPLISITRTYHDAETGTYGQFVKGYDRDAALGIPDTRGLLRQGEVGYLIHLISGMAYRSNVGFMEVTGKAATVEVSLFSDLDVPLGTRTYPLFPLGFHQVNNIFQDMGVTGYHSSARAEVRVTGEGSVLAYASIVNNTTNDGVFTLAQKLLGVSSEALQTLAVAANTHGAKETLWHSDVRVLNPTAQDLDITYTYRPVGGDPAIRTLTVPPWNIIYSGNAVPQLFGIVEDSRGSLEVKAGAPLVVSSRVYTGEVGTYGQYVPSYRSDQGLVAGGLGIILGLRTDEEYRTNLGMTEIAGGSLSLLVRLFDTQGIFLGERTVALAPYEHLQWNNVFSVFGIEGFRVGYAEVECMDGGGRAAAYASVVDNRTGDAIYVPAQ